MATALSAALEEVKTGKYKARLWGGRKCSHLSRFNIPSCLPSDIPKDHWASPTPHTVFPGEACLPLYPSQHPFREHSPTSPIATNSCDSESYFQGNQERKKKNPSIRVNFNHRAMVAEAQLPGCSSGLLTFSAPSSGDRPDRTHAQE